MYHDFVGVLEVRVGGAGDVDRGHGIGGRSSFVISVNNLRLSTLTTRTITVGRPIF